MAFDLDSLSRSFASRSLNRRSAIVAGASAVVAGSVARAAAQDATPEAGTAQEVATDEPEYLFVQLAERGTWMPKAGRPGVYELTLTNAGTQSLYFSDRPSRIVGTLPTADFLDGLGFTPELPPNAAAVVRTPEGERDVLVIELFDPVYTQEFDADGGATLRYDARVLDVYVGEGLAEWKAEQADDALPSEFTDVSLFIDGCPDANWDCYGPMPDGLYARLGPLPGGPYRQCSRSLSGFSFCGMCMADEHGFVQLCNATYPKWCQGRCQFGCNIICSPYYPGQPGVEVPS